MSFFNIARVFTIPVAAIVVAAYGIAGYGLFHYLTDGTPVDDPRLALPAAGFLAMLPGVGLLAFSILYRQKMWRFEFNALATIGALGVMLLPGVFASALFFNW